jgi:hypothetical protein
VAVQITTNSYVLRPEVVAACVDALWNRDTHQHFPAYLQLRRQAGRNGSLSGISPDWSALSGLLRVPGGPYGRPHLRPFWKGKRTANQEWLGDNLAGSYSPASLRSTMLLIVEIDEQKHYTLRDHHWGLALDHLLYGRRMEVLALAGFLLRDYAFITAGSIEPSELVAIFRKEFGYRTPEDDVEFSTLYSTDLPFDVDEWFQPWSMTS